MESNPYQNHMLIFTQQHICSIYMSRMPSYPKGYIGPIGLILLDMVDYGLMGQPIVFRVLPCASIAIRLILTIPLWSLTIRRHSRK